MASETIGIGMIGCGTVGCGVVELLRDQAEQYETLTGKTIELRKVLVRNPDSGEKATLLKPDQMCTDVETFFNEPGVDVVLELAGGVESVSGMVRRAIEAGKHVITANKALLAAEGPELFALARKHKVSIGFEASCAGGIPIVTSLCFGLQANRVTAMYGILNGTSNYILTEMTTKGKDYETALAEAQQKGYAEADPTLDVGGGDTAHKLAILASLAFGQQVHENDISCNGIDHLALADILSAEELGYRLKLLGIAERSQPDGPLALSVEPCLVHRENQLAAVSGSFNAVAVYGHAVGQTLYFGRGAGKLPTASAVVSDLLNVSSGWFNQAFQQMHAWPDEQEPAQVTSRHDLRSRFYLRFRAMDKPGVLARVSTILGEAGISLTGVVQHEPTDEPYVPLVVTTHHTSWQTLSDTLKKVSALDVIEGPPVVLRIVETPAG